MADLQDLLEKTSRTFALSIPLLPEPTYRQVGVAYLLFRIADTFEDSPLWSPERRIAALEDFCRLLEEPEEEAAERLAAAWDAEPAIEHEGYRELLRRTPDVLAAYADLAPRARRLVGEHTARTARGMAGFVDRGRGGEGLLLEDVRELRDYCYVVAGIVGEMLTELFLLDRPQLAPHAPFLRRRARAFGEALQLVNILKDSASDRVEGRRYLPPEVDRGEVFALARRDLTTASQYVLRLQEGGAPRGFVAFTALPVRLAWATLERVEAEGAGAKISRPEVAAIVADLDQALDTGAPAAPLPHATV